MTKHIIIDEDLHKCQIPIETQEFLCNNSEFLENHTAKMPGSPDKNLHDINVETIKEQIEKRKLMKLSEVTKGLINLELDSNPEKPINLELCVDLYQMEDY